MRAALISMVLAAGTVCGAAGGALAAPGKPARSYCPGAYAEDLVALSAHARHVEAHTPAYAYAVRTTATYECVSYAPNGQLQRSKHTATAHGTAFGFRYQGGSTLMLTNEHVAAWPMVTDEDENAVDGVPRGCKRVSDGLTIVDDDEDDYAGDDIQLERVVVEPSLDIAILRARAKLQIIPWRIGRSGKLASRDVVEVKGFPLGAFRATNIGKVISAHDHDVFGDWDHDDFVIDALLSHGNSGSPVLAVSCKTREFELVGVYHAHYSRGSALNVVVAIDQLGELLRTLRPLPHPKSEPRRALDARARKSLVDDLRVAGDPPFFALGALTASVRVRSDGALVFAVYSPEFPKVSRPLVVLEDRAAPPGTRFGELGAIYVGGPKPLRRHTPDDHARPLLERALDLARRDLIDTLAYRAVRDAGVGSRAQARSLAERKRALDHQLASQADVTEQLVALATHASTIGSAVTLAGIEASPQAPPAAAGTAPARPAPARPAPARPAPARPVAGRSAPARHPPAAANTPFPRAPAPAPPARRRGPTPSDR
ncbi:MAG TPA: serine protease [Kofleriaceae bacterium]|nr:serine protease [Kofleriaceae bacterium]